MSISNARSEIAGTNAPNFYPQDVPKFGNVSTKHSTFGLGVLLTFLLFVLYFALSEGFVHHHRWLRNIWDFPFTINVCYLFIKYLISGLVRHGLQCHNGKKRAKLSFRNMIVFVVPPGIANGLDKGFSNWALEWIYVSLYAMTRSTTILFILGFTLLFRLERKSSSLIGTIGTVVMMSGGLVMFMYSPPELNLLGIILALLASVSSAFQWTMPQYVMQKSKHGLENPIDVMYHTQPWMILGTIPIALWFEGAKLYSSMFEVDWTVWGSMSVVLAVFSGGAIAFCLVFTEFLIISRTSSLSLFVADTCRVVFTYLIKNGWERTLVMNVHYWGLGICCSGIILYIIIKFWTALKQAYEDSGRCCESDVEKNSMDTDKDGITTVSDVFDKENQK